MYKLIGLILPLALLLSACAQAAKPTPATVDPKQVQVTESDQGKEIALNPGDSLVIELDSNPSTGYNWEVQPVDQPVLQLAGEPAFKANDNRIGSPGKTTLTLKAVSSGSQVLTLQYRRSFEKNVQPLKTFAINVTVSRIASLGTTQQAN